MINPIGGSLLSCTGIHAHVQRPLPAKAKSPLRAVQLRRTHPQVGHDAIEGDPLPLLIPKAMLLQIEIGKIEVPQLDAAAGDPFCCKTRLRRL